MHAVTVTHNEGEREGFLHRLSTRNEESRSMRRKGVDIEEEKWAYNFSYVRAKGGDSSCKARWFATEPLFPVVTPSSPRIWIRATIPLRHDQKFAVFDE